MLVPAPRARLACLHRGVGSAELRRPGGCHRQRERGLRIGQRFGDADLIALGLTFEGFALVRQGDARRGLDLLDEAMASASAGELGVLATGITYCRTLCACFDMCDFRSALEWAAAIRAAGEQTGAVGFPGDCRP